jgi:hypothetical protein
MRDALGERPLFARSGPDSITAEAYEAIKATLPGLNAAPATPGSDGLIRIWLDRMFVDPDDLWRVVEISERVAHSSSLASMARGTASIWSDITRQVARHGHAGGDGRGGANGVPVQRSARRGWFPNDAGRPDSVPRVNRRGCARRDPLAPALRRRRDLDSARSVSQGCVTP